MIHLCACPSFFLFTHVFMHTDAAYIYHCISLRWIDVPNERYAQVQFGGWSVLSLACLDRPGKYQMAIHFGVSESIDLSLSIIVILNQSIYLSRSARWQTKVSATLPFAAVGRKAPKFPPFATCRLRSHRCLWQVVAVLIGLCCMPSLRDLTVLNLSPLGHPTCVNLIECQEAYLRPVLAFQNLRTAPIPRLPAESHSGRNAICNQPPHMKPGIPHEVWNKRNGSYIHLFVVRCFLSTYSCGGCYMVLYSSLPFTDHSLLILVYSNACCRRPLWPEVWI